MAHRPFVAILLFASAVLPFANQALAQAPAAPTFVDGDPATLACRIVGSKLCDFGVQQLTIEVRNPGPVAAEPLAFELTLPGKKGEPTPTETFTRAQFPHFARFGRPVPAGGKLSYQVLTALPAKKGQLGVRVTAASFGEGGTLPRPPIEFGKPEQVQRESMAGTFPVTQVAMKNPLPHAIDVLLQVRFEQPKDVTELVGVRLPPNGTLPVLLATRPGKAAWIDPLASAPGSEVKAVAFEVVDWCAVGDDPGDAQIAALRTAWDAWYRWPEADVTCAGDYAFRLRRLQLNSTDRYDEFFVRGRFTVDRNGKVATELLEGTGANGKFLLQEAIANLRRPDFASLATQNRLQPVASDRVALVGPGLRPADGDSGHLVGGTQSAAEADNLEVRDGLVRSDGRGDGERSQWEWRDFDGARVVVRRHGQSRDLRFAYALVGDRIVPTAVTERVQFGANPASIGELILTNVTFEGVVPIQPLPPRGDGVAALRSAWDAAWRIPPTPTTIEAKFVVQCGNDGVWQGTKRLSGSLVLRGLGRAMVGSDITFDGSMPREQEVQLAALVRDRFGIWQARDFNDRGPFDTVFRGATIHAADAAGTFAIDGGPVAAVTVANGLVRTLRGKDGSTNTFTYAKLGEHQVVVRIEQKVGGDRTPAAMRWDASVQLTWQPFGEHLLPTKMVFERIFGREWGPESITLSSVRVH